MMLTRNELQEAEEIGAISFTMSERVQELIRANEALVMATTHLRLILQDSDRIQVQSRCLTADLQFDMVARDVDAALTPFEDPQCQPSK